MAKRHRNNSGSFGCDSTGHSRGAARHALLGHADGAMGCCRIAQRGQSGNQDSSEKVRDWWQLKGDVALVETQAGGHGQGRQSAPQIEWQPKRLGANIPEAHIGLRDSRGRDVCASLGIPPALYAGGDGGSSREAYRQLLTATLEPLASIITHEFREKVGYPVTLDFKRLAAADIAARARAYGTLVASNVDPDTAAEVSGLTL